jgi:hypothetical protein
VVKHIGFFPGSEIIGLNTFEARLGKLPPGIYKIRELIKRYEACHFKYRQHVERIKNSIRNLKPEVDPGKIGRNHIQHGEHAWTNDSTGRSLLGQQFVWAAKDWMDGIPQEEIPEI